MANIHKGKSMNVNSLMPGNWSLHGLNLWALVTWLDPYNVWYAHIGWKERQVTSEMVWSNPCRDNINFHTYWPNNEYFISSRAQDCMLSWLERLLSPFQRQETALQMCYGGVGMALDHRVQSRGIFTVKERVGNPLLCAFCKHAS